MKVAMFITCVLDSVASALTNGTTYIDRGRDV
jgi:hypothetical protein